MAVSWLIRSLTHYRAPQFKTELCRWGSERERAVHEKFSSPKRRREWLLGRLTAKELIQRYAAQRGMRLGFLDIEILGSPSGRPYFEPAIPGILSGQFLGLSISHCRNLAFCTLTELSEGENIGCDIEYVSPRPSLFVSTFYTESEQARLASFAPGEYDLAVTAVWSLKEAALKAIGEGLRYDTRSVDVHLAGLPRRSWEPQTVVLSGKVAGGCLRCIGSYVLAWVAMTKEKT